MVEVVEVVGDAVVGGSVVGGDVVGGAVAAGLAGGRRGGSGETVESVVVVTAADAPAVDRSDEVDSHQGDGACPEDDGGDRQPAIADPLPLRCVRARPCQ